MALLRCECGHGIWSELWWKDSKHVLLFFDDLETSDTYGERVVNCPGCGRRLRNGILSSANDGYGAAAARRRRETV